MRTGRQLIIGAAAAAILAAGCTTNPATGEKDFTPFMTPSQEKAVGKAEHPNILRQFGGAYGDPGLQAYVTDVGNKLAANSELPND